MQEADQAASPDEAKPRSRRKPIPLSAAALGAVCALLTVGLIVVVFAVVYSLSTSGPRLREVTRESFDAARALWKENGPQSYNIEIAVEGPQKAVYRVEVRDRKIISATRNGAPLTDDRTMGTWSVPGMFDTMAADVAHSEDPIYITARESHYVSPMALFDPQYGYPARYRRIEWGSDVEASWVVTEFRVVE